jgi:hypothetical protein
METLTSDYRREADKRFATARAEFFYHAGFELKKLHRIGNPLPRFVATRNEVTKDFETIADAMEWLAAHLARKAAIEAGEAQESNDWLT